MIGIKSLSVERWVLLVICILALLSVVFMRQIVEPPKVLLGQMLTSISPSLFPTLVLTALALLSGGLFFFAKGDPDVEQSKQTRDLPAMWRGIKLFLCMLLYALTMEPLGFFASSFVTIILVSLLTGNGSAVQILSLAIIGPVTLYLVATRLLAVSLPELNAVELFYAKIPGL